MLYSDQLRSLLSEKEDSSQQELNSLVTLLKSALLVRKGEVITDAVAEERARNIAAGIYHAVDFSELS